jgi:iron complex outermembrane receptor protein
MRIPVLLSILLFVSFLSAQPGGGNKDMMKAMQNIKGRVYGKLVDANTGNPVEFAAVAVLWFNKDSVLGGSLTEENGDFNIENLPGMGNFRLRAIQVGYKKLEMKISIQPPSRLEQDLGDLKMTPDEKVLQEVEVVAEKSNVTMSIDKRTYNVDKDLSVKGGTAIDAMKNVPGLTVDGDGNVQLRNQGPLIYVDGRPTTMTLEQIPADQIERIEVITNPSVKFDASSTGGIVNIVMKKNSKPGYNGMAMAYIGTGDRYGGMVNLNVKEGKWNFSLMYNYNQAINQTKGYTHRTQLDSGEATGYFNQDNNTWQRRIFNFGKLGVDYKLSNRNTLSLNQTIMGGWFKTNDVQDFQLLDGEKTEKSSGTRINDQNSHFENYNSQLLFKRTYARPGKELTTDANFSYSRSDNGYQFSTYSDFNTYQKNSGYSQSKQGVVQFDFVNPLNETDKLETGIKAYLKESETGNNTFDSYGSEAAYIRDSTLSNRYLIHDMINAAYVNFSSKTFWNISYQAGLRFEQSYYRGTIADKNLSFFYNYPSSSADLMKSIFPAVYFSKKLSKNQEFQLNFSRKIQRPNFFQLMPFVMFADRQNYRIGNPTLKPEFRNMTELNYNKLFTGGNYLGSVYFRYDEQPITDIAYPSPSDANVLVNTTINGDNSYRYGMEHTVKFNLFKKLDLTLNGNAYSIFIRGRAVASQPALTVTGFAFDTKATLSYKLPKQLTAQLNGNYESPRILLLGTTLPVYSMDFSIAKVIGKWSLNLLLSDVFNTRRFGNNYSTPYYTQVLSRRREARYLRFSVSYMFGKMDASIFKKPKQKSDQGSQDNMDFGG